MNSISPYSKRQAWRDRASRWVRLTVATSVVGALSLTSVGAVAASASSGGTPTTFHKTLAGPSEAPMYPSGMVFDPYNNELVLADTGLDSVDVYSSTVSGDPGKELHTFGSVGTGNGQFQSPRQVAVDPSGNIYVADAENNRIQAFKPDASAPGGYSWEWTAGQPGSSPGGLNTPIGITWDTTNSNLLVADTGQDLVKAYSAAGAFLWASPKGLFVSPRDADRGPDGRIWVADYHEQEVKAFTVVAGKWTTTPDIILGDGKTNGHGLGQLNFPYNTQFSPDGKTVYVADTGNDRIARWSLSSLTSPSPTVTPLDPFGSRCTGTCVVPGQAIPAGEFEHLRRVSVDPAGNIWASDFWGSGIHEFNPAGTAIFELDGVPAKAPGFAQAYGVAVGSNGMTYVVDRLNQRIEVFSASGAYVNSTGQRGVSAGTYSWPEAVGVAPDGTVWVGDTRNGRLEHYVTPDMTDVPTTFGTKGSAADQFNYIDGLTVDANGIVYAADASNNRIHTYNPATKEELLCGTLGSGAGQLDNPEGVAVNDATNTMYVADTDNSRVEEFTVPTAAAPCSYLGSYSTGLNQPEGVTLAPDGSIWVANTQDDNLVHLSANLVNEGDGFGSLGTGDLQFDLPHSLAIYNGVLFVADTYNSRVQEFKLGTGTTPPPPAFSAKYSTQYDAPGGTASLYPDGGAVDASGNRYLADMGNSRVVKITPAGTQTTLYSGLMHPRGLDLNPSGTDLWISDSDNNRLVEITLAGTPVGTPITGFHSPYGVTFVPGDDTDAYVADTYNYTVDKVNTTTSAITWKVTTCMGVTLQRIRAITTGSDGNIYASDTDNNRIVEINPSTGACLNAFGTKGSGNGQFNEPRGITSDGSGGLWVGDDGNYRVEHVSDTGTYIAQTATTYGTGTGQLNAPQELFMDNGQLAICDTYNYRVEFYNVSAGGVPTLASNAITGTPPSNGGFNEPWAVTYGPSGELYVADSFNFRVEAFKPDGTFDYASGTFGTKVGAVGSSPQFQLPRGIAVTADGTTLAVTQEANDVELLDASTGLVSGSVTPLDHSGLMRPRQVTFAPDGTLWVADYGHNRVIHMDQTGQVLLSITNGGLMKEPQGVALDAAGNVYVSDTGNNAIEEYSATTGALINGTLATAGSGPGNVSGPAELNVVGPAGSQLLLIADANNNRIQVLTLTGSAVTTFGTVGTGPGNLSSPNDVALRSSDGQVAVADFTNSRISIWNSTGATTGGITTTTVVSASPPSPAPGASVTLTATVSPTPDGGKVAFTSNGSPISGCGAAVPTAGKATCKTTFAMASTYSIVATYAGDATYNASTSSSYSLVVAEPLTPTTTTASLSESPIGAGATETLSAHVSPTPDGGTVGWSLNGAVIAGCAKHAVNAGGAATCNTTFSSSGTYQITAIYSGDATYATSTSAPVTLTVGAAARATTTVAGATENPVPVNTADTLTATVSPVPDGGTVAFDVNGVAVAACKSHSVDANGVARCSMTFATKGAETITAVYSGDSSFLGSTSAGYTLTVEAPPTATTSTAGVKPATVVAGLDVALTATVSPLPDGGTVEWLADGVAVAGCKDHSLNSSGASRCTTFFTTPGTESITVMYSGDSAFAASTSKPVTLTVT